MYLGQINEFHGLPVVTWWWTVIGLLQVDAGRSCQIATNSQNNSCHIGYQLPPDLEPWWDGENPETNQVKYTLIDANQLARAVRVSQEGNLVTFGWKPTNEVN